jgi:uncharacterized membrane protein
MRIKLPAFVLSLIFGLNTLIIFITIFESQLQIPQWLQVLGRMHPILLHFPIVLLLLASLLEFFRFQSENTKTLFYQLLSSYVFVAGILSTGITVLMGLILSIEEGYEGETLDYHKWFALGTLLLASILFKLRDFKWYSVIHARIGSIILILSLIIAGHFGAVITHGDNFVLEPITQPELVPLEQAKVYDHVIQPIFQEKCISCHNDQKLKGNLKLTDEMSILKGGKTGKLLVAGYPNLSLLLQRVHLPSSDKKHMPPAGKPQLTEEETQILYLWIKDQASFSKKVIDLKPSDSLRMLAASRLKPAEIKEEQFDFNHADEKTIQKLNTFYRVVSPISQGSAALNVSFFGKSGYNAKSLDELSLIEEQIVGLSLSKMPVKDADLKKIAKFKSLRKLDLNFTDISGSSLNDLMKLPSLKILSLSGTSVNLKQVQPLLALKNLEELTIWNTKLSESELNQLKKSTKKVRIISGFKDDGTTLVKLSPPFLKNKSRVFIGQGTIELTHPRKGVIIKYTLDGTEPDSLNSTVFKNTLKINNNSIIKAKAFKNGWLSSDVITYGFLKTALKPEGIKLINSPNEYHKAAGANSLIDGQLGDFDSNNNNWLGFKENDLEIILEFSGLQKIENIALNTLISANGGYFPPSSIQVYGATQNAKWDLLTTINSVMPNKESKQEIKALYASFKPQTLKYIKIIAKPVRKLPMWHPAKGQPALLLVDELLIN